MKKAGQTLWPGVMIALLGCLMMGYGIYRGEVDIVFAKAIRICLECIGIG